MLVVRKACILQGVSDIERICSGVSGAPLGISPGSVRKVADKKYRELNTD